MRLLKRASYQKMPWKNGLGSTEQIAVDPAGCWRLSAATVKQASSFSEFKDRQRLLAIWRGHGLKLNQHILKPNEVYAFSGEEPIVCEPLQGEVIDLGLIYQTQKYTAEMDFKNFQNHADIYLAEGMHFLFCADGAFEVNQTRVDAGDTLCVDGPFRLNLPALTPLLKLIHVGLVSRA